VRQQYSTPGNISEKHIHRRRYLSALGTTGVATLAGCSERGGEGNGGETKTDGPNGGDGGDTVDIGDFPQFGVDDLHGEEIARELAQQAFEQSEYDYGFDGGNLVSPAGDQVELDIYHSTGQETSRLTAEFIAKELGENLGIDVAVEAIDSVRFNNEHWVAEPRGGTDTVDGNTVEWASPTPQNPGPRSVTSREPWDMSTVFGLNTHPLNPLTNELFFAGADSSYNPVGYYPRFNARELFEDAGKATNPAELREAVVEILENLAREQPYITLLFSDDLVGYTSKLSGPAENFSNGWDLPAWYFTDPAVSGSYDSVTSAAFETLNPLYHTEGSERIAIGRALDRGYTFDENQEYFPLLYDMSTEHGAVWTFEVRENLRFSEPYGQVTAEDFVYLIQELHQSDWANTAASTSWDGVEVEQTGRFEFQATLERPTLLWPQSYDPLLYPIPRGLVEPYVEEEDADGLEQDEELLELRFTGNLGAFTLDEWNRGSGTTYTRNDEYYLRDIDEGSDPFPGVPLFEAASISVVQEQASHLEALEAGEIDSAAIPLEQYESYDGRDAVTLRRIPTSYSTVLSVNQRDNGWGTGPGNLFQHVSFRQAVASAISKDRLIQDVYRGLAEPQFTWQPRWSDFHPANA